METLNAQEESTDTKSQNKPDKYYIFLFSIICLLILVVTLSYGLIVESMSQGEFIREKRGTFGDMFGGLNAIFSGFAFAGVIITILMQMKELELTRIELRKAAEAQEKSQIALNNQLKSMQVSARLDSVQSFLNANEDDIDKSTIARGVLDRLTEQIFYESDFIDVTKPSILIEYMFLKRRSYRSPNGVLQNGPVIGLSSGIGTLCIIFTNLGSSFEMHLLVEGSDKQRMDFNCTDENGFENEILEDQNSFLPGNRYFVEIYNVHFLGRFEIKIRATGLFVPHEWEKKVNVKVDNLVVEFIEEPWALLKIAARTK